MSSLRLSDEALQRLKRFGLTQIGQLYKIDRAALARRFHSKDIAQNVLKRLDQALGLRTDPITPLRPEPLRTVRLPCPEPIASTEAVWSGLETLAKQLCEQLSAFGQGARSFTLHAFRSDSTREEIEISAARPVRTPQHILTLFKEKLDHFNPGFGIDLLLLEARRTGSMTTASQSLSPELSVSDTDPSALAALADRITARLGENTVYHIQRKASHLPERAQVSAAFTGTFQDPFQIPFTYAPRPLRLLATPALLQVLAQVPDGPPLRFVWRRIAHQVSRADGPERINPEWWHHLSPPPPAPSPQGSQRGWLTPKLDPRADANLIQGIRSELEGMDMGETVRQLPRTRDYYRVEDQAGRRYWIFREGLYDDNRGALPDWYLHGVFA